MEFDTLVGEFWIVTGISATAVSNEAGTCAVTCWNAVVGHGAAAAVGAVVVKAVVPKYATAPFANSDPHSVNVNAGSPTFDRCVPDGLKTVTRVGGVDGEIGIVNGSSFDTVLSGVS